MNRVPLSACRINPSRSWSAPVNALLQCPKSMLSTKFSGNAAQSSTTNGPDDRRLLSCTALAKSSLPVPVSPVISTGVSVPALWATLCRHVSSLGALPMMADRLSRVGCSASSLPPVSALVKDPADSCSQFFAGHRFHDDIPDSYRFGTSFVDHVAESGTQYYRHIRPEGQKL